jgi:hypothetical protein
VSKLIEEVYHFLEDDQAGMGGGCPFVRGTRAHHFCLFFNCTPKRKLIIA